MRLIRSDRVPVVSWSAALVVLRTFLGIAYFTNGLAKLIGFSNFTIGPWTQYLINRPGAKGVLTYDVHNPHYGIPLARDFAHNFVLPNWDVIGWVVTAGELGVGIALLLGIFGRLGAFAGFLMALMLFIWDLGAGGWTYDYLYDVVLLGILMLTPNLPGLDRLMPWSRAYRGRRTVQAPATTSTG